MNTAMLAVGIVGIAAAWRPATQRRVQWLRAAGDTNHAIYQLVAIQVWLQFQPPTGRSSRRIRRAHLQEQVELHLEQLTGQLTDGPTR